MRIIAVDDDEFILELIPMIAAKAGFADVTAVSSGKHALQALDETSAAFDCFLLDIHMPEMDGIELCSRIRAMPEYRKSPILMLTAITERSHIDRAFKAGATDYASKPFDVIEIGARLRVAQELVLARRSASNGSDADNDPLQAASPSSSYVLSEPLHFAGFEDLITYRALKNYLQQLSRAGLAASQVMAVKIEDIAGIHQRASDDEFLYALREAADAISEVFRPVGLMMASIGQGTFVLVLNGSLNLTREQMEAEIQDLLDDKNSEYDDGFPLDIEVSVGGAIKPNISQTRHLQDTIDRAIARAESQSKLRQNKPRDVNIRQIGT